MPNKKSTNIADVIAQNCVAGRLRLINRVVTSLYDNALRPLGIKASQFNILVVAEKRGQILPAQVCEFLRLDASTVSRNVDRMRVQGWVEVVPTDDAREQPFRLTVKGRKLLEKAAPGWEQAQAETKRLLGDDGIVLIRKMASKLGFPD